jgi:putative dehydrogenase
MNVVIFGLGSMGFSIALNMLKGGHKVWGVDLDAGKVDALVAQVGEPTVYSDHLSDIDAVVLTVVNEAQVTSVLFDDPRLCDQLNEHSIIICRSTVSPEFTRETEQKPNLFGLSDVGCRRARRKWGTDSDGVGQ